MTPAELITYVRLQGVELRADGDRLRYSAPKGVITPALASQLTESKREILALLRGQRQQQTPANAIPRVSRDGNLPLSFAQERFWFLDQINPESNAYNVPLLFRIEGPLDVDALRHSFGELIRRHEVFRTACTVLDDQPVVEIVPPARSDNTTNILSSVDLTFLPKSERSAAAIRLATEEVQRHFDLSQAPLLRAKLLRLDDQQYMLAVSTHHFVIDGWSVGLLWRDLSAFYDAYLDELPSSLPGLPVQYVDFSAWQRNRMQGEFLSGQLSYWTNQLKGTSDLTLPTDRPRPAMRSDRGSLTTFEVSEAVSDGIRSLSRRERTTVFMTLLAAFKVMLHRYSGQDDVAVGTMVSTRHRTEIEDVIGSFANTLVLRTDLTGDPSFRELLQRVRKVTAEAHAFQELPFELLVEHLNLPRDLGHNPLFQIAFVMHTRGVEHDLKLRGVQVEQLPIDAETSRFDVGLAMTDGKPSLAGKLEFNTDLYDRSTIERMVRSYCTLLEAIARDPGRTISELPLMTEAEERRLLVEWNDTTMEYDRDACIHHLFEEQARRAPEQVALVFEGRQMTYGDLDAEANRVANYLAEMGVRPEDLVGICMERSIEMVTALLGILKAGASYVPLDPMYPPERLARMVEDARPKVVVAQNSLNDVAGPGIPVVFFDEETLANTSADQPMIRVDATNLAYVIYTSGSTGTPKGVMIPHRALCNHVFWRRDSMGLTPDDRLLQKTSLSFDVSAWEVFGPLSVGARLVLARSNAQHDTRYLVDLIAREEVTMMTAAPSLLRTLLEVSEREKCRSLRLVNCGGEVLSPELVERCFERLPAQLFNGYGPTEATVGVTYWECRRGDGRATIPIGKPISNTKVYVLDSRRQPVPVGVVGEIYLGGASLARGYLNRPELTDKSFVPNPFRAKDCETIYRTGDLGRYLPDGNLEFRGRVDRQVKLRGLRIELGEIESILTQQNAVQHAVALVREVAPGDQRLVAYVVGERGSSLEAGELRRTLGRQLPEAMIPGAVIVLERLPLTPNGKLDLDALPMASPRGETFVAPRNPLEAKLAELWAEILDLEKVGVTHDFFALGGHSLHSVAMISRIRDTFQAEIPLSAAFENPTIEQLAVRMQMARTDAE